jgi:exopolysaccharide biosynthesis polyprenyl glycosylphosphotransferase
MSPISSLRPTNLIRKHGWPKVLLVLIDIAAVTFAALTTLVLHYFTGFDNYDTSHELGEYMLRIGLLYISTPILLIIFRQNLLYKHKVYSTKSSQFALILRSLLINSLVLIAVLFFVRQDWIMHSRTNLILFALTSLGYLAFFRIYIFRKVILPGMTNRDLRRVLVVGSGEAARAMLEIPFSSASAPFQIAGIMEFGTNGISKKNEAYPHIGFDEIEHIGEFIAEHDIDEVIVAEDAMRYDEAILVINECKAAGVSVNLLSDHFRVIHERVTRSSTEYLNVAAAPISAGFEGPYSQFIKRPLDILTTTCLIILFSPFLLALALLVKLGSKGPLFFSTEVIGQDGKAFRWYKFRSMYVGEPDGTHREHVQEHIRLGFRPTGKLPNDPRITPIGRWLRKHSLDELPQLWSVLRGDMSLIGPRPCLPYEFEQYDEWHKERFIVRPGITGLWQVSGRSSVSFNDMVILDLYYIHNLSLWLDAAILFRTLGVVLTGEGGG